MINNVLTYYYGLNPQRIYKKNNEYHFNIDNKEYIFAELTTPVNLSLMMYINNLLKINNIKQYYIKQNKMNQIVILYNNKKHILLEKIGKYNLNKTPLIIDINNRELKTIYRNDWKKVWIKRMSFIEYQLKNNRAICEKISDLIIFFSGMCENAIQYINNTHGLEKINLYLQSKNVNNEYIKPWDIIIDYKVRIIAENIKNRFWNREKVITDEKVFTSIKKINATELILLFSRLLFVDEFWNNVNQYILKKNGMETFDKYYLRYRIYLDYLNQIAFSQVEKKVSIEEINWIKKGC